MPGVPGVREDENVELVTIPLFSRSVGSEDVILIFVVEERYASTSETVKVIEADPFSEMTKLLVEALTTGA
jgi:hypothetical protein